MKKKSLICLVAVIAVIFAVVFAGKALGLWEFGFSPYSLVGLLAVVPAVIWVLLRGVNFVNSALYFAGIGYIMFRNVFRQISLRFIVFCVLMVLLALSFGAAAQTFKDKDSEAQEGAEING